MLSSLSCTYETDTQLELLFIPLFVVYLIETFFNSGKFEAGSVGPFTLEVFQRFFGILCFFKNSLKKMLE